MADGDPKTLNKNYEAEILDDVNKNKIAAASKIGKNNARIRHMDLDGMLNEFYKKRDSDLSGIMELMAEDYDNNSGIFKRLDDLLYKTKLFFCNMFSSCFLHKKDKNSDGRNEIRSQ
jgi:hypothetical protein